MNEQDGYIRNNWALWLTLVTGALLVAGVVWATTPHTITVDGDLADFTKDELTAGDAAGVAGGCRRGGRDERCRQLHAGQAACRRHARLSAPLSRGTSGVYTVGVARELRRPASARV